MYHHRIPCYGELMPGVPGVVDSKPAERVALLLPDDLYRRSGDQEVFTRKEHKISPDLPASCLYACLRLQTATGDLKAVLAVARDFSPRVMAASETEVLLDVSGLGRLIGEPPAIARALAHAIFDAGLTAHVAIAPTQTAARLLARAETGHGLALRHKDHKEHEDHKALCDLCNLRGLCGGACVRRPLEGLAVHLLQELEVLPPGMHHRDRARPYDIFQRWGIATLGDLAALPAAELSARLGRRGVALHQLARGLDLRPFVPDGETPRFTGRLELEWPIDALEPLSFVLARLLDPLSAALERADRGAIAVRVELRLTDRTTFARVLPLPAPMRDPRVLRTLVLLALESGPPSAGIDAIAIELDPAPGRITQFSLLERAVPSLETLSTLTARLSALVGASRVGSAVLLDSHAPDAFAMTRFAPDAALADARPPDVADRGTPDVADPGTPDLKVGLTGLSLRTSGSSLRRQRTPPAIRVAVERGRPVHIASSRRGLPYGAITQSAGPWRMSGGWWTGTDGVRAEGLGPGRRAESADAVRAQGGVQATVSPKPRSGDCGLVSPKPRSGDCGLVSPKPRSGEGGWDRDEWDVSLASGAVCRIFRDRGTERWFFDGLYD